MARPLLVGRQPICSLLEREPASRPALNLIQSRPLRGARVCARARPSVRPSARPRVPISDRARKQASQPASSEASSEARELDGREATDKSSGLFITGRLQRQSLVAHRQTDRLTEAGGRRLADPHRYARLECAARAAGQPEAAASWGAGTQTRLAGWPTETTRRRGCFVGARAPELGRNQRANTFLLKVFGACLVV